jgi:hypothetical protein
MKDDLVEAEAGQQGEEDEDPGDPGPQPTPGVEVQPSAIRDLRDLRADG